MASLDSARSSPPDASPPITRRRLPSRTWTPVPWRRQARSAANLKPRWARDSGRRQTTDQPRPYPASVSLSFTPGTRHLQKRTPGRPVRLSRRDSSSPRRDASRVPEHSWQPLTRCAASTGRHQAAGARWRFWLAAAGAPRRAAAASRPAGSTAAPATSARRPHPGADDLAREWYEPWPLAGQELAGARRAHTIRSPGQWSADVGDREHVLDGAAEAVELPDHDRVTGAQVVERGREARALRGGLPIADLLGVDPAAPGLRQRVLLKLGVWARPRRLRLAARACCLMTGVAPHDREA